ncbi:amino acid adenylation domain-containing protein [Rhizobium skierniewicense]|uniref:amino acid adenylation domain-containing protein n=1 Tax=Rhizobium skierniewicense TaxID=984260 RepID=UPI00192322AD|nr:amino acid adenylation domain-containing protein [Rhizobium skierniewicense]
MRDALLRGELDLIADFGEVDAGTGDDVFMEIARFVPGASAEPDKRLVELGLDSLSAARLAASVRARLGIELSFSTLFAASAESLAAEIANARSSATTVSSSVFYCTPGQAFELSEMQQAYWIGQQSGVFLGQVKPQIRIDFQIQQKRVAQTVSRLKELVVRHPALRISVSADGHAIIGEDIYDPLIEQNDLRALDSQSVADALDAVRARLSDDDRRPLAACLSRINDHASVLHLRLGLIAGDLRSMLLLVRELAEGVPDEIAPYIASAKAYPVPAEYTDAWEKRLDAIAPPPELPVTLPPSEIEHPRFLTSRLELPEDVSEALQVHAKKIGVTLSSLCIAAFVDVLRLWSASPDLTINLTCNTIRQQDEQTVGDYTTNTLITARGSRESFADFARAIQSQVWADLDQPWCTGVSMLRDLGRRRKATVSMPVVLTSFLSGDRADNLEALDALGDVIDVANPTPQVSLHSILAWRGKSLMLTWEHVAQMFDTAMVEAMFASFADSLIRIATAPSSTGLPVVASLPLPQKARQEAANDTFVARSSRRLEAPFLHHANLDPGAVAIISGEEITTYGALLHDAEDIASALQRSGVRQGDIVAAIVEPDHRGVAALIAIMLVGAVYLPIEKSWPHSRVQEVLAEAKASYAVTAVSMELPVKCLRLDRPLERRKPVVVTTSADDIAYMIFTSGSTGRPKGVVITHKAAANTIDDINERFDVGRCDRTLCVSSITFDLSVYDIFGLLAVGGCVVFPSRARDPDAIAHALVSKKVTIWNSVPAVLELLLDVTSAKSADLRLVLLSGDWISPTLCHRIKRKFETARPISLGGATEASIWSVFHLIDEQDADLPSVPYGKPLTNQTCFVHGPDGRDRPEGVAGELLLGGAGLALGYCGNEEETSRRFFTRADGSRLYRTGDLARWMPNGELELLGRIDDQVKVQGYRIELGEIEAVAMRCGGVARAVASVVRRHTATALQLHVIPVSGYEGNLIDEARAEIARHLPSYMWPHHIGFIDALPLSDNGKIDRSRLPAAPSLPIPAQEQNIPRDEEVEENMIKAFTSVVGTGIDPQQRFFDVGATSLDIVRLRALLERQGVSVPSLADFFSLGSIRAIASFGATATTIRSNETDVARIRAHRQRRSRHRGQL